MLTVTILGRADMTQPSRGEVSLQLQYLLDGSSSREEVAAWAMLILNDDNIRVCDAVVLEALKFLGGADLMSTDRPYLYMEADFASELAKLNSKS